MHRLATLAAVTAACVVLLPGPPASAQETPEQESPAAESAGLAGLSPVTWERLVGAADEPHNWLMYSGTLDSQRFSRLDQVNRDSVADLELKWAYSIRQLDRAETTPLVVDGVMFITESPSNVTAVDATTGRPYWRYEHPLPDDLRICCGRNNRGVAILGETLYMSNPRRPPGRPRRADRQPGLGPGGWPTTAAATAKPLRRWSSRTASSPASRAASSGSAASWTPTTPESGERVWRTLQPSPGRTIRTTAPGPATRGGPAARRRGSRAPTTRS